MGDALLKRRALAQSAHSGEERGLEPAAVLIQALQVQVEPESNQPSRVSSSLVKPALEPQWGQVKPSGRISSASLANQALEPFSAKSLLTAAMVSSLQMGLPQSAQ